MRRVIVFLLAVVLLPIMGIASSVASTDESIMPQTFTRDEGYQYVECGMYPFSSNESMQPILWRVLSINGDGTVLLQSARILDAAWGNKYSNDGDIMADFIKRVAFSKREQKALCGVVGIPAVFDMQYDPYGYPSNVSPSEARALQPTPWAASKGLKTDSGNAAYWCMDSNKPSYVSANGAILRNDRTRLLGVVPMLQVYWDKLGLQIGDGTMASPYTRSARAGDWLLAQSVLPDCTRLYVWNPYNRSIPVYSGPGSQYYQDAGMYIKTHKLKLNVFGRQGDWLMIEYAIDRGLPSHLYRVGYVYYYDIVNPNSSA